MKIISQNANNKGQVLLGMYALADSQLRGLRLAVAYITKSGCDLLFDVLSNKIGKRHWDDIPKAIITSFDFGFTEPAALASLDQISNCEVSIWGIEVLQSTRLVPNNNFHPKMYIFDKDGASSVFIGSANLSRAALTTNTEAAIVHEDIVDLSQVSGCWNDLSANCAPLTPSLLVEYRTARKKYTGRKLKPRLKNEKPAQGIISIPTGPFSDFNQAVSTGAVAPQSYKHFWIEAGSMSSGGSGNQLELPRGANRFFGFNFTNYSSQHQLIGYPVLFSRDKSWLDRPLTWHGHNAMERINLPTVTQGGYMYQNTIVHFSRHNNRYELQVFPWNHPLSQIWINNSQNISLIFNLGIASMRACGLY
jgi:HKD family nuclease